MSGNWRDFVELPESAAATPLKLRHPAADNIQSSGNTNSKKRAPTTPLTPSLIQRNILKRKILSQNNKDSADQSYMMEEFMAPSNPQRLSDAESIQAASDFEKQIKQSDSFVAESGSPKHRRSYPLPIKDLTMPTHNTTPRISAGIKQAVQEHKKSRLQILKATKPDESCMSDSELSEVSTIAGDTPNYKFRENLVYYKNGYYMDNFDDSYAELERSQIVNEKELARMDNLVEFMKLERQFQMASDDQSEI